MSVSNCKVTSQKKYEKWRAEFVEALIMANKESLLELGQNPQKYVQICNSLTKIGSDCKPIENEPKWQKAGSQKFGYTKVRNKCGKYNFVDEEDNVLYKEDWFDVANDFVKNKDNVIRAYTNLNGDEGFLYLNPIVWKPI